MTLLRLKAGTLRFGCPVAAVKQHNRMQHGSCSKHVVRGDSAACVGDVHHL
jgi:hypothetical protein